MCVTCTAAEDVEMLESNTRLLLHAKYAARPRSRIIIQSPDMDVLVLYVAHFDEITCEQPWFRTGVKDRLRYVPVHMVSEKLGQ